MITATEARRSVAFAITVALLVLSACARRPSNGPPPPPAAVCPGMQARVRPHPDTPLSSVDRAAIQRLWCSTLRAIAAADDAALQRLHTPCGDGAALAFPDSDPTHLPALASRWDAGELLLDRTAGDEIHASVGPLTPAMPGLLLHRSAPGVWGLCAFHPGE